VAIYERRTQNESSESVSISLISPLKPTNLSATTVSSNQIDLSWTDSSDDESGFKIERKTGSGGTYSQIAIISANLTSYSDTPLSASTTYYYRVLAYNDGGSSDYSAEAHAITSAAPNDDDGGGGCFIATAAYGSPIEPHVVLLREFRDRFLLANAVGKTFVDLYYTYSPPMAHYIENHDILRGMVRVSLLPLVGVSYSILQFGPMITLTILAVLLVIPILLDLCYRRKARGHKADS